MKVRYKYIHFEELTYLQTGKTKYYECLNNSTGDPLGIVEWEGGWRQYIFTPNSTADIFSAGSLIDIADFIKQIKGDK